MMGRLDGGTEKLFYAFSLEEAVPTDHLLRKIDRFLDFDGLRAHLRPYYSAIGRPSVDPELMVRMLLVGYGTAEMLAWIIEEKAIAPHVPLWDKGEREDGTFGRSDFVFDEASNSYRAARAASSCSSIAAISHDRAAASCA